MPTHPGSSEPTTGAKSYSGSMNHFGITANMPAGGPWIITKAAVWAAGYGASPAAKTCVWRNDTGVLLGQSDDFTLTERAFGSTGSDLYDKPLLAPTIAIASGFTIIVGFAISPLTSGCFFGQHGTGTTKVKDATVWVDSMSGAGSLAGAMGAYVTYQIANTAPTAPTLLSPSSGVIIGSDLTPALAFKVSDPNGDDLSAYQIQVDNNSDFSSPVWDSGKTTTGGPWADDATVIVDVGATLARGVLYYWRVRVWDDSDLVGAWTT